MPRINAVRVLIIVSLLQQLRFAHARSSNDDDTLGDTIGDILSFVVGAITQGLITWCREDDTCSAYLGGFTVICFVVVLVYSFIVGVPKVSRRSIFFAFAGGVTYDCFA